MRHVFLAGLALAAAPAAAQQSEPEHNLQVMGIGKSVSQPDVATIEYWLAGEGATPDEATSDLVAKRKAISDQVTALLSGHATLTDSNLIVLAARGSKCQNASGYNAQPQLSVGDCAITGYLATAQGTIRTSEVSKAGTAVGLASRLGARDARLKSFGLSDDRSARRAAVTDAVADARKQAAIIAAAAGRRLGPVIAIRDQNSGYGDPVVVGSRSMASAPPPPPPPPPPPVEIDVNPRPIETITRVDVRFALLP